MKTTLHPYVEKIVKTYSADQQRILRIEWNLWWVGPYGSMSDRTIRNRCNEILESTADDAHLTLN